MQLSNSFALAKRGDCMFTTKAKFAQLGGAKGLLVINDDEGSYVTFYIVYIQCIQVIESKIFMLLYMNAKKPLF